MEPSTPNDSPPPPKALPEPSPLPWRTRLAAGFALLVAVLVVGWAVLRLQDPGEEIPPPPPPPAVAPTAVLVLEAAPWGEVREILGPDGLALPLPAEASTPLVVELPTGSYRIRVVGPSGEEARSCEATLAAGGTEHCRLTFGEPEASDYFREAGWWD